MAILEGEKTALLEGKKEGEKATITICMYWVNPEFSGFGLMGWVFSGLGFLCCNPTQNQPMVQRN